MNKRTKIMATALLAVVVVGALGATAAHFIKSNPSSVKAGGIATTNGKGGQSSKPPLTLKDKQIVVVPQKAVQFEAVPVIKSTGEKLTVNVKDAPIVFLSDWDADIITQLKGQTFTKAPIFVVTLPNNEDIQTEIANVKAKVAAAKVSGEVFGLVADNPLQWITGLPDTYVWKNGQIIEIPGPLLSNETKQWQDIFTTKGDVKANVGSN